MLYAAKKADEATVQSVARQALEDANGDAVKATDLMVKRVHADTALYRLLMDPLVKSACYQAVAKHCRDDNRAVWHSQPPSEKAEHDKIEKSRVVALAEGTIATLYDIRLPLPGHPRLGDAMRDDVTAAKEFYHSQGIDMMQKARWYELIAKHLPAKKTVRKALSLDRLTELRSEAMK